MFELRKLPDIENANIYEHELLVYLNEGGGNSSTNMNLETTIYLIVYSSKPLNVGNQVDYTGPPLPPSHFHHAELTPVPKLDQPLFSDRFVNIANALRKLG